MFMPCGTLCHCAKGPCSSTFLNTLTNKMQSHSPLGKPRLVSCTKYISLEVLKENLKLVVLLKGNKISTI